MKQSAACCIFIAIFLCACTHAPADLAGQATEHPAPTETSYAAVSPAPQASPMPQAGTSVHARQYGTEQMLFADGNGFSGTLRYPQGGVQPINRAVMDWAGSTEYALETAAAALPADGDGMRFVFAIEYDAYQYENRFVGLKFTGTGKASVSGEAKQILYAYNYDLLNSRALGLSDVITQTRMDAVRDLVQERLGWLQATPLSDDGELTAAEMQDFVIRDDGIEWLFPGSDGVTGVLLGYALLAPYLCMEAEASPAPAAGEELPFSVVEQQATCLYDGVQLRTLPSVTEGETIATVYAGERLDVVRSNVTKGWHKVDYRHQVAYVNARLVQLAADASIYTKGFVKSGYLHVRARAATDSELLGTMLFQEPVRILDSNAVDGWYKIWYEGQIAYVSAQYVSTELYPPETQTTSFSTAPDTPYLPPRILREATVAIACVGTCATDGVLVHSAPYPEAPIHGALAAGEQVFILAEACAPGWDRIFVYTAWNSGYVGYVQASGVQTVAREKTTAP